MITAIILNFVFSLLLSFILKKEYKVYFREIFEIFFKLMLKIIDISLIVDNQNNLTIKETYILIFSHSSILDSLITYILAPKNTYFIAKKELFYFKPMSKFLTSCSLISIDRKNKVEAIGSLKLAENKIKENYCIAIAPEGTRRRSNSISDSSKNPSFEFKKGAFHMCINTRKALQPIIYHGAYRLSLFGGIFFLPGTIYVDVQPRIDYKEKCEENVDDLIKKVKFKEI